MAYAAGASSLFRVQELIQVINYEFSSRGHRKRMPAGFCYVCSQLDPRGRGQGRSNPYRHLFARGLLKPCPHFPRAPHPTFVTDDGYDDDYDDGFDEDSGSDDGAMFDTKIIRDDEEHDPRLFSLPPVFGGGEAGPRQQRRAGPGRVVPMVSEDTFLTTNHRAPGSDGLHLQPTTDGDGLHPQPTTDSDGLHLPRLPDGRASLVAGEGGGGGGGSRRRGKGRDPRRLHSERIDRRVAGLPQDEATRSDSAIGLGPERSGTGFSREKTDPPPQPIVVSIRNQDGEVIQKLPLENLAPGTLPSEAFADHEPESRTKKREKKRRSRSRTGSASPSFSGSMSLSGETASPESPDYFLSRLRSASWCECPDRAGHDSRCGECRRVGGHEKWCVSRNSLCPTCGKAFKRKYAHLDRKSSLGAVPSSGVSAQQAPGAESPSRRDRHQNCSPSKAAGASRDAQRLDGPRETSGNRVRFTEDGGVVYPQWETFPDCGVVGEGDGELRGTTPRGTQRELSQKQPRSYLASLDANVHKRAYSLALAAAKLRQMSEKKRKSKKGQQPKGVYFSYFPLLTRRKPPPAPSDSGVGPASSDPGGVGRTVTVQALGLRADLREGKQLKVKKGLKHILGDVKLEDYYPGGKRYSKSMDQRS